MKNFRVYSAHEDSQDHPFWWDRYPARGHRVHLQKDPFHFPSREICDGFGKRVATLDLSVKPIGIQPISEGSPNQEMEDETDGEAY